MIYFFTTFIVSCVLLSVISAWFWRESKKVNALSSYIFKNLFFSQIAWISAGALELLVLTWFSFIFLFIGCMFFLAFGYLTYKSRDLVSSYFSIIENYKKVSEESEIKKQELFEVINKSLTPSAIVDKDMNYVFINEAWFKIFEFKSWGYKISSSLEGKNHYKVFLSKGNSDKKVIKGLHKRCLEQRQSVIRTGESFTIDNGNYKKEYIMDWGLFPINGNKMLITVQDRTEELKSLSKLESKNNEYRELIKRIIADPYKASQWATHKLLEDE